MEVLEIVVANNVVEFRGEGGDNIIVTVAQQAVLSPEELIEKSKIMLLHAATFDVDEENSREQRIADAGDEYRLEYHDNGERPGLSQSGRGARRMQAIGGGPVERRPVSGGSTGGLGRQGT